MVQATITYGVILTVILLIVSLILLKATPKKSYITYFPGFIFFAIGLICLLFATILENRVWILNAGFGGWGLAFLFSAGITLMITAVADAYRQGNSAS